MRKGTIGGYTTCFDVGGRLAHWCDTIPSGGFTEFRSRLLHEAGPLRAFSGESLPTAQNTLFSGDFCILVQMTGTESAQNWGCHKLQMSSHSTSESSQSNQLRSGVKDTGTAASETATSNSKRLPVGNERYSPRWFVASWVVLIGVVAWSYWPTLSEMVHAWETHADYSHGYLVLPLALFFLWHRRREFPATELRPSWWGAALLLVAVAFRIVAGRYYLLPVDGWTLPLTIGGVVWLVYGTPFIKWSWPSIVFLWFMVPFPYSAERLLSVPLQSVATKLSTATLVALGAPAFSEGNVILLGDHTLFVEEACSGMRIFFGIFALAFAFVLFSRWAWWQKTLVLLAALPVAIAANVLRIVVTGLLYQWVSSDAGQKFSHDVAGFVMIPIAAIFFWLFLLYLDRLFPQEEEVRSTSALLRN